MYKKDYLLIILTIFLFQLNLYSNVNNNILTNTGPSEEFKIALEDTKEAKEYNNNLKLAANCLVKFDFTKSIEYSEIALKYRPNDFLVRALICLNDYEIAEGLDIKNSDEKRKGLNYMIVWKKLLMKE